MEMLEPPEIPRTPQRIPLTKSWGGAQKKKHKGEWAKTKVYKTQLFSEHTTLRRKTSIVFRKSYYV